MKRICIALKEDHTYYDVAFFYCDDNYNITTEESKRTVKCYINNDKYHFYDQTDTSSYAYEVWKRFFE